MAKRTCRICRARKLKCDGGFPICGRCSAKDLADICSYGTDKQEKGTKLLNKEACLPCRRKKIRCDAVKPLCGRCKVSRIAGNICSYGDTPKLHDQTEKTRLHASYLRIIKPALATSPEPHTGEKLGKALIVTSTPTFSPEPISYRINSSFPRNIPLESVTSTISNNPALRLLDFDDPFTFALSEVSLEDLNMRFRFMFLLQRFVYGVHFPPKKLDALLLGDTSSRIVHCFFIHFAHFVGAQFYQERLGSYSAVAIQARHLRLSWDALKTMKEESDPLAFAQANFYIGCAYTYVQSMQIGKRYLKRAVEIIDRRKFRFVPISVGDTSDHELKSFLPSAEPLDLMLERVSLLSQMVFIEVMSYLLGQPSSILGYHFGDKYRSELLTFYSEVFSPQDRPTSVSLGLEQQFRYELPEAYPNLISPVVSRVQSEIFSKDGHNIIEWFRQSEAPSHDWVSTCRIFLSHLTTHIAGLSRLVVEGEDAESRLTFRYSCIISFTTYAKIAFVLAISSSSDDTVARQLKDRCSDALRRVIMLVEELGRNEFLTLNAFLGVTWSRALSLFAELGPNISPSSQRPDSTSELKISKISSITLTSTASGNKSTPHSYQENTDLEANIARIAQLNGDFIRSRFIPGTFSLCAKLAEYNSA